MSAMRISDARRLLFIHVEKTGGSTIDAMMDREVPDVRSIEVARHAPLQRILEVEPALTDYWICGFVRNPWDRMVSWWAMVTDVLAGAEAGDPECLHRMEINPTFWDPVSQYDDFETFLARGTKEVRRLRRPQVDYVRTNGRRADFIGRMEQYAAGVAAIRSRLGLPPLAELPRDNASTRGDYRDYYTPATKAFVGKVFAKDVEAFGYTFGPSPRLWTREIVRRIGKSARVVARGVRA